MPTWFSYFVWAYYHSRVLASVSSSVSLSWNKFKWIFLSFENIKYLYTFNVHNVAKLWKSFQTTYFETRLFVLLANYIHFSWWFLSTVKTDLSFIDRTILCRLDWPETLYLPVPGSQVLEFYVYTTTQNFKVDSS